MSRASDLVRSVLSQHGYTQLKKVGEGSFGAAILVKDTSSRRSSGGGEKAIVKIVDLRRAARHETEDALKESRVLSSLQHPNIVRYRETFLEDGFLGIAMDYCEGGDLSNRIRKKYEENSIFPEQQVLRWFTQAVMALRYIHERHILHRDLKSSNFFLSGRGNLKIGDFGIAKMLDCTAALAKTQIGTPYYLSPEIMDGRPYNWAADIWSMGCILYEMCALRVPFEARDLRSLMIKVTQGATPELPQQYSSKLNAVLTDMLQRDPTVRPEAAEIIRTTPVNEMARLLREEFSEAESRRETSTSPAGPALCRVSAQESRRCISVRRGVDPARRHSEPSSPPSVGSATPSPPMCRHRSMEASPDPRYARGDAVEYYSEKKGRWVQACITNIDTTGNVMIDVKPGAWLSVDQQAAKLRPCAAVHGRCRVEPGALPPPPQQAPSDGASTPSTRSGASVPRPGELRRSPSVDDRHAGYPAQGCGGAVRRTSSAVARHDSIAGIRRVRSGGA